MLIDRNRLKGKGLREATWECICPQKLQSTKEYRVGEIIFPREEDQLSIQYKTVIPGKKYIKVTLYRLNKFYIFIQEYVYIDRSVYVCKIYLLDTYKYIFKEYFDDNSNNTKSETKKFDDIKKIIKGEFIKKKSYSLLVNKYKNCENDIPLWTLSIYWTFGAINKLFKYLNQELSNKVLENISFNISKKELFIILESFRLLRNDYCHNCVIYNFSYQIYDKIDSPILISGSNRIWIYEIICILDKLNKREHKDNSLKNLIEGKIKEVSKKLSNKDLRNKFINTIKKCEK